MTSLTENTPVLPKHSASRCFLSALQYIESNYHNTKYRQKDALTQTSKTSVISFEPYPCFFASILEGRILLLFTWLSREFVGV